jgi:hypothetical protein
MITLPRQAQDKRKESAEKEALFLSQVIGCKDRHWVRDENLRYTDGFVLSGMTTGPGEGTKVWRLSPEGGALPAGAAVIADADAADAARGNSEASSVNVTDARVNLDNILNVTGLLFDWCTGFAACDAAGPSIGNATVQFEGGALLQLPGKPLAPTGAWIVQPAQCTWCVRVVGEGSHWGQQTLWPIPVSARGEA